jgi:hypothetical protein
MAVTTTDKYREVRRELAYRRNVYRRLVAAGQFTQAQADRRIEVMTAIVEDYRRKLERERNGRT